MEKKTSVLGLGYFTETLSFNGKEDLCFVNNLYNLYIRTIAKIRN